jgi:hypothetical protein
MEANIIFDNVKAYNVTKFDVLLNESFAIELVNLIETAQDVRWFSDNDPVLSIEVQKDDQGLGTKANIKATKKGVSEIQLQVNKNTVKTLFIEVYDVIATALNISASEPVLKNKKG